MKPARGLLLAVVAWKVGTELLRLPAGEPFWEIPEQGVTFAAPLALLFLTQWRMQHRHATARPDAVKTEYLAAVPVRIARPV